MGICACGACAAHIRTEHMHSDFGLGFPGLVPHQDYSNAPCLRPRPSDVLRSKNVVEAGRTKSDELCSAMFTYKVGRFSMQAVDDLIRRRSQDIVSDTSYKAALEMLSFAAPDILVQESDAASSIKYVSSIPAIGSKLLSA